MDSAQLQPSAPSIATPLPLRQDDLLPHPALIQFLRSSQQSGTALLADKNQALIAQAFRSHAWSLPVMKEGPLPVNSSETPPPIPASSHCALHFPHAIIGKKYDLVYDQTYFCGRSVAGWFTHIQRIHALLRQGGTLAGLFFYPNHPDGPQTTLRYHKFRDLFSEFYLAMDLDLVVEPNGPMSHGQLKWQEWRSV
jgi:hypothetical protein